MKRTDSVKKTYIALILAFLMLLHPCVVFAQCCGGGDDGGGGGGDVESGGCMGGMSSGGCSIPSGGCTGSCINSQPGAYGSCNTNAGGCQNNEPVAPINNQSDQDAPPGAL